MAERSLTVLELHFHNHGDVEMNAGGSGSEKGLASRLRRGKSGDASDSAETSRRTRLPVPLTVGAVALLALAVVTWQGLRGE